MGMSTAFSQSLPSSVTQQSNTGLRVICDASHRIFSNAEKFPQQAKKRPIPRDAPTFVHLLTRLSVTANGKCLQCGCLRLNSINDGGLSEIADGNGG
jgi:hypothetical protein